MAASSLEAHLEALNDNGEKAAAASSVTDDMAALRSLTADTPTQQSAIMRLQALADAAAQDQASVPRALVILGEIRAEERRLLVRREAAAEAAMRWAIGIALVGATTLAGTVFFLLFVLVERQRDRSLVALAERNADLEARVAQRTAELADSVARQRSYFDNSPIAILVMHRAADGGWIHEDLNPIFTAISGFGRSAVIGRRLEDVWPAPLAQSAERWLAVCARRRRRLHHASTHDLGGSRRDLDIMLTPLRDAAGNVVRVLATLRDVTKEKELQREVVRQAALRAEAAERETAVFRNSPDVLFVVRVEPNGAADRSSMKISARRWRAPPGGIRRN